MPDGPPDNKRLVWVVVGRKVKFWKVARAADCHPTVPLKLAEARLSVIDTELYMLCRQYVSCGKHGSRDWGCKEDDAGSGYSDSQQPHDWLGTIFLYFVLD